MNIREYRQSKGCLAEGRLYGFPLAWPVGECTLMLVACRGKG